MSFKDINGSKVVLRGMSIGAPMTMLGKRMERIFRHGDVAYAVECLITTKRDSDERQCYHPKIREILSQYEPVFGPIPLGHIKPNTSPFASSVVLVLKKDGTLRMYIKYHALNKKTIKNRYPIPKYR
jgi:hypothetical protein